MGLAQPVKRFTPQEYYALEREAAQVEVYERQAGGSWLLREASGLGTSVAIPGIDVTLPLAEIYERVEFPPSPFPGRDDGSPAR